MMVYRPIGDIGELGEHFLACFCPFKHIRYVYGL